MKKSSVLLVLLAWTSLAAAAPVDVKVLSWNIRRGIGSNVPNSTQQPFLAKTVNYLNPDVWTINELGGNAGGYNPVLQRNALNTFISSSITTFGDSPIEGRDYFVYVGVANDGFIGNSIVSRFPLSEQITYSDGLRGLVHANVQLPNGETLGVLRRT